MKYGTRSLAITLVNTSSFTKVYEANFMEELSKVICGDPIIDKFHENEISSVDKKENSSSKMGRK